MGVEIGAVPPDVAADLAPRTGFCPPEKNAVLEDVDEAARLCVFVLAAQVDGCRHIDQWDAAFLQEEHLEPVVEDKALGCLFAPEITRSERA